MHLMVSYISGYTALVQQMHSSDGYQNATAKERKTIDEFLEKKEIKKYFGRKVVSQFSLHESFVLGFVSSDIFHQRTPKEQYKVLKYLGSASVKRFTDNFEKKLNNLEKRVYSFLRV